MFRYAGRRPTEKPWCAGLKGAVNGGFVAEANVLDLDGTRHAQYLRL